MSKDRRCIFDTSLLGECADYPYGFTVPKVDLPPNEGFNPGAHKHFAEPCVFLKLNKIFNWEPKPISCHSARCAELEDEKYNKMSDDLKSRIRTAHQRNDADNVWVECFGRYPADKEALELKYFPDTRAMPAIVGSLYRLNVGRGMMKSYTAPGTRWGSSSLISTCYLMVIIHPNT